MALVDCHSWNSVAKGLACVLLLVETVGEKQQQLLRLRFQLSLRATGPSLPFFGPYFLLQLWLCVECATSPPQLPTASISCANRLLGTSSEVVAQSLLDLWITTYKPKKFGCCCYIFRGASTTTRKPSLVASSNGKFRKRRCGRRCPNIMIETYERLRAKMFQVVVDGNHIFRKRK